MTEQNLLEFDKYLDNNTTALDGELDDKAILFWDIAGDVLLAESVLLTDNQVLNQWATKWCVAVGTTDGVNNGLATVGLPAWKNFVDLVNYIRDNLDDQIDNRGTWIKNWPIWARKLWWIKWFSYITSIDDIKKALTYWLSVASGTNQLSWSETRKNNYVAVLWDGWGHHMNICGYEENWVVVWADGREYKWYFIIENSWGDKWWHSGYYYVPFDIAEKTFFNTKISMVVDTLKNSEYAKEILKKLEDEIEKKNITTEKEIILQNIDIEEAKKMFEAGFWNWKRPRDPMSRQEVMTVFGRLLDHIDEKYWDK